MNTNLEAKHSQSEAHEKCNSDNIRNLTASSMGEDKMNMVMGTLEISQIDEASSSSD